MFNWWEKCVFGFWKYISDLVAYSSMIPSACRLLPIDSVPIGPMMSMCTFSGGEFVSRVLSGMLDLLVFATRQGWQLAFLPLHPWMFSFLIDLWKILTFSLRSYDQVFGTIPTLNGTTDFSSEKNMTDAYNSRRTYTKFLETTFLGRLDETFDGLETFDRVPFKNKFISTLMADMTLALAASV